MKFKRQLALILLALSAAGCSTLWPDYEKPPIDLPAAPARPVSIDRQWWKAFGDPVLDAMVVEALANNRDLAKAAANVEEARAAAAGARSFLLPRLDGGARVYSNQRQLTLGPTEKEFDKVTSTGTIGLAANWEIDLWDRIGQLNDAALARLSASEHTRDAVELSVSTLVVDTWFQLRGLDFKLALTRESAASQKKASELEYRRWKADVGTELAYSQTVAEYTATEARIPALEGGVAQTELALKLLVGRSPRMLANAVPRGSVLTIPDTPRAVDSQLLLRRPDVASAELLLVAAHADVNSARAEFYPRLTLSLLAGFVASTSSAISGMPLFWEAGAGLAGPIFDGGLTQSKVDGAEARRQKALAHYQYTVSLAFRDTYLALVLLDTSDREVKSVEEQVATRRRAVALAEKSYEAGRSAKFEVLSEQVRLLNAQLALVDAKFSQFTARSQYYKAVGGGF